jgi:cytochrome c oxidase subunit 2
VKVILRSRDVLHSFFLPNLRVKQDAVPGMTIPVWFNVDPSLAQVSDGAPKTYDLTCAELCGWGHYKMRGRLTVQSPTDFQAWLVAMGQEQEAEKEVTE